MKTAIIHWVKDHKTLLFIFLLALLLRTVGLSILPNGVFTDEIVSGYVGRYIFENGIDLYGNPWPLLYFNKFGDYRVIFPMYLTGLATYVFGNTIFALRIVPAIFGALIVFPMYYFSLTLTKKKFIALTSAFFITILPWHIMLSRAESEGIIGLTLLLCGMVFFLKHSKAALITAALLFLSTFFFYPSFRLITPFVAWTIPLIGIIKTHNKTRIGIAILLTISMIFMMQTTFGKGRFEQTSIFSQHEVQDRIYAMNSNYAQAHGPNNAKIALLFHNRYTGISQVFLSQAAEYFSPNFLFIDGGKPYRYAIPSYGLIPLFFGVLIILAFTSKSINKKILLFLLLLTGISILPAAITTDDIPNMHRSLFLMIPLILLASIGWHEVTHLPRIYKSIGMVIFVCVVALESIVFLHHYIYLSPSYKSVLRDDGYWQGSQELIEKKNNYEKIIVSKLKDFPVYVLYQLGRYDASFASQFHEGILTIPTVDNITFVDSDCPEITPEKEISYSDILYVVGGDCPPYKVEIDNLYKNTIVIPRRDSTKALRFIEVLNNEVQQ